MNKKAFWDNTWKIIVAVAIFSYVYIYEFDQDWIIASLGTLVFVGMIELASSAVIILYQTYRHFRG